MAEVATSSFAGEPQPVELLLAGRWVAGELLGWRHDDQGGCRVRVRCVVGGLRHTAWTDLTQLRLPPSVTAGAEQDTRPHRLHGPAPAGTGTGTAGIVRPRPGGTTRRLGV